MRLAGYEDRGDHVEVRVEGEFSAEDLEPLISEMARLCASHRVRRLFVDARGVRPLPVLTVADRYQVGVTFAKHFAPAVRVVLLTLPELIDPRKFGVMVARNRGLTTEIFSDRDRAVGWLLTP
jgi:hypothetical protein